VVRELSVGREQGEGERALSAWDSMRGHGRIR
jgi:hypothetical protein